MGNDEKGARTLTCARIETEFGWVGIIGAQEGLVELVLPVADSDEVLSRADTVFTSGGLVVIDDDAYPELADELRAYFAGEKVEFTAVIDSTLGSPFQRSVWRALRAIPYGETRSYGEIAAQVGVPKGARAVGGACGANPVPLIIPCHRVLAANGAIGGFGAGLEMKRRLLKLEGIATT